MLMGQRDAPEDPGAPAIGLNALGTDGLAAWGDDARLERARGIIPAEDHRDALFAADSEPMWGRHRLRRVQHMARIGERAAFKDVAECEPKELPQSDAIQRAGEVPAMAVRDVIEQWRIDVRIRAEADHVELGGTKGRLHVGDHG